MNDLRRNFKILVGSVPYTQQSGGARALYLLVDQLNRLGFDAHAASKDPWLVPENLNCRTIDVESLLRGRKPPRTLAIYPEVFSGNVFGAPFVARYLLARPGMAEKNVSESWAPDDFVLTFDAAHVPAGRSFHDLYMPVVDRRFYYPPPDRTTRDGFIIVSLNAPEKPLELPAWAQPLQIIGPHRPRTHGWLSETYRHSRAMIAFRRSAAIYEALCCGCPVLAIPSTGFSPETFQPRFGSAGISWSLTAEGLAEATATVPRFIERFAQIEQETPAHIESVFLDILAQCEARLAMEPSATA